MVSGVNGLGVQNYNNKIRINNNLRVKPNFSTTAFREEGKHVTVDGKQYDVKEVSDWMACDKTKQVVVIDGKSYDVREGEALGTGLLDNILNPHICYNA